jgi:hypothetical protein
MEHYVYSQLLKLLSSQSASHMILSKEGAAPGGTPSLLVRYSQLESVCTCVAATDCKPLRLPVDVLEDGHVVVVICEHAIVEVCLHGID